MEEIRWVLFISGMVLVVGIVLYEYYLKPLFGNVSKDVTKIEPTINNDGVSEDITGQDNEIISNNIIDFEVDQNNSQIQADCDHVITVRLSPIDGKPFDGKQVLEILKANGLSLDHSGIFNYVDNHKNTRLFSAANLVEPGIFDIKTLDTEKIPGLSFFMLMPLGSNEVNGFDEMMTVLKKIKISLKAELLDDAGSTLSIQRERYIREEVIEYMLKSNKNSPSND